jgi:hypothetical protein
VKTVLETPFLFDPNVAVGDMLEIEAQKLGMDALALEGFVRWGISDEF